VTGAARLHAESSGRGPRVVLVHGFTQTGRSWGSLAASLASDHEVVVVDAPGHAGSDAVRADLPTGAALLGDVGGEAAYVGYSMGARLCLLLALARPDLVHHLVLLSGTAGIDDDAERAARRAADETTADGIERDGVDAFLARWLAQPMFAGLAALPGSKADLADRRRNTAEGLASSLRLAGTGTQAPLWSRLAELTMPVTLLAGEHDEKFVLLAERMAERIPGATLHVVPRAGHAVHLERPHVVLAVLSKALAQAT
jgi:2-succinyl-6-hydroxy-2,4-cyclohexadiene-1-carboxylate synthase